MKTIKKIIVLLSIFPVFCSAGFAAEFFDINSPKIKKAEFFLKTLKQTKLNRRFASQLKVMLESSFLFSGTSSLKSADFLITIEKSVESKEILISVVGAKKTTFAAKYFGIRFKNKEEAYIKQKTAQMGNRIIKEIFGISGSLGSSVTWSVTDDRRKVIFSSSFGISGTEKQLTYNFFSNYGASWNPQKDQIIYTSHTDQGTVISLQTINPLILKTYPIFSQSGKASSPIWAPDGTIILTLHVSEQNSEIFQYKLIGKVDSGTTPTLRKIRQLTYNPTIDTEPTISPDSRQMAFVSDQTSEPQIYILDLKTQKMVRLTSKGGYNVSPAWSPNGKYIAFRSIREGVSAIFRINIGTKKEKQLTQASIHAESPTWSPDGSLIAFTGKKQKKGKTKIYYVLASGGKYRRLTNAENDIVESSPSWGPAQY